MDVKTGETCVVTRKRASGLRKSHIVIEYRS